MQGAGTPGVTHDVLIIDMDQEYKQFTQELRLASNDNDAKFRWIAGLYYLEEKSRPSRRTSASATTAFPGAHPSAAGITPPSLFDVIPNPYGNTVSFSISDLVDQSYSAYGQIDWQLRRQAESHGGSALYAGRQSESLRVYAGAFLKPTPTGILPIYIGECAILELARRACPTVSRDRSAYIAIRSLCRHRDDLA